MIKLRKRNIEEILKYDFISAQYASKTKFLNFETNGICECDKYCVKEGVCRAFKITGVEIESVDLEKMALFIWKKWNNISSKDWLRNEKLRLVLDGYDQKIDIYCIERILTIRQLYLTSSWTFTYRNGYYGQEVECLTIDKEILSEILNDIEAVFKLESLKEKIEFLLKLEYGFVIDHLKDGKWTIEKINKENVYFPQKKQLDKVRKSKLYRNRNVNSIMGICIKENNIYKVVDGYNRISQTKNKDIWIITTEI